MLSFARICGNGRRRISNHTRYRSMTSNPPTFKFGRRIASPPSSLIFFTPGVLPTLAAGPYRRVAGCPKPRGTFFGIARRRERAEENFSAIGMALLCRVQLQLVVSAIVRIFRLRRSRCLSGLGCSSGFKMMLQRANLCGDGFGF